jgi:hypothetical protein
MRMTYGDACGSRHGDVRACPPLAPGEALDPAVWSGDGVVASFLRVGVTLVVHGVLGVPIGLDGGCHSERGLLRRYVQHHWCFMVDAFFGQIWPRRSLAGSSRLMGKRCVGLCLTSVRFSVVKFLFVCDTTKKLRVLRPRYSWLKTIQDDSFLFDGCWVSSKPLRYVYIG